MDRPQRGCLAVIGLVLLVPLLGWLAFRMYNDVIFTRDVGGRLKRAADSNSIELAKQELDAALKQMEARGLTTGYTSIVYTTPDEDIGFWYNNIKTCVNQINELPPTATQGEKDLVLLKLRQTLLDHGKNGHEAVTVPPGIAVYPHNTILCLWLWISAPIALVGCFMLIAPFTK